MCMEQGAEPFSNKPSAYQHANCAHSCCSAQRRPRESAPSLSSPPRSDALEACSLCSSYEERQECLSIFGLDAEQVDTHFSAVYALEQALAHDTGGSRRALRSVAAAFLRVPRAAHTASAALVAGRPGSTPRAARRGDRCRLRS